MPRLTLRTFLPVIFGALLGTIFAYPAGAQQCAWVPVSTVQEMIDAINDANAGVACSNRITLRADLSVSDSYEGSESAFPTITSHVSINLGTKKIARVAGSPSFRFFHVDARNGLNGRLDLRGQPGSALEGGGGAVKGGAVLVDANGSDAGSGKRLSVERVAFRGNTGNLGGAVAINAHTGGHVTADFTLSVFDGNEALLGGGLYLEGYDHGYAKVEMESVHFRKNHALASGGALHIAGWDQGRSEILANGLSVSRNRSGKGAPIYIDAENGGDATLKWGGTSHFEENVSGVPGNRIAVAVNAKSGGNVTMWQGWPVGKWRATEQYTCYAVGESEETTGRREELSDVPCP